MDKLVGMEQENFRSVLNTTRAIIRDIKSHVMEPMPTEAVNPGLTQAAHKLANLRQDIKEINQELEDILRAVSLL